MPIEIRELIIKAVVSPEQENGTSISAIPAINSGTNNGITAKEEIIHECMERIMQILKDKKER